MYGQIVPDGPYAKLSLYRGAGPTALHTQQMKTSTEGATEQTKMSEEGVAYQHKRAMAIAMMVVGVCVLWSLVLTGSPVRSSSITTPRLKTSERSSKRPVDWYTGSMYLVPSF